MSMHREHIAIQRPEVNETEVKETIISNKSTRN